MFDQKLKEGVAYFEQMLKVMPDDRTTLEFLSVVYPQMGEKEKAEHALAELARVLLKEGDLESAGALVPRLEECESAAAKAMVVKIAAAKAPRPELVPETMQEEPAAASAGLFAAAVAAEATLAEKLGENDIAEHLRALPDNGNDYLVSALSTIEKEKPELCERHLAALADEFGEVPIPLEAFEAERSLVKKLTPALMKIRGVVPFAKLGDVALVAYLSPTDAELKASVSETLGGKARFYLAEPRAIESALAKLFGES